MSVGTFELCVAVGNQIEHWWRYNSSPGSWNRSAVFGADVRRVVGLIQSSYSTNLEVIAERTDGRWKTGASLVNCCIEHADGNRVEPVERVPCRRYRAADKFL